MLVFVRMCLCVCVCVCACVTERARERERLCNALCLVMFFTSYCQEQWTNVDIASPICWTEGLRPSGSPHWQTIFFLPKPIVNNTICCHNLSLSDHIWSTSAPASITSETLTAYRLLFRIVFKQTNNQCSSFSFSPDQWQLSNLQSCFRHPDEDSLSLIWPRYWTDVATCHVIAWQIMMNQLNCWLLLCHLSKIYWNWSFWRDCFIIKNTIYLRFNKSNLNFLVISIWWLSFVCFQIHKKSWRRLIT